MTDILLGVKKVARCTADIQAQFLPDVDNPAGATVQTGTTVYTLTLLTGNMTTYTRYLSDSYSFPTPVTMQTEASMTPADGLVGSTQNWELTIASIDAVVP